MNMNTFHNIAPCFINLITLRLHMGVQVHKLRTEKILILVTDRDTLSFWTQILYCE